jgi:hypothetical protein
VEGWLRSHVPQPDAERLLAQSNRPHSILQNGRVQGWLGQASKVDDGFARQVRFTILQSAAGLSATQTQMERLQVSSLGSLVCRYFTFASRQPIKA